MVNNGISLVYLGTFSHEITKMFTSMAEEQMDRESEDRTIKMKVYHSMVETLQNLNKHSDEISSNQSVGRGLFLIGKKDNHYYIITANKVSKNKIEDLKSAIEQVNHSSKEELKDLYKKQLKDGKLSSKGGAGLGLIDIARKTDKKLEYEFLPLDETNFFFILKVEIDTLQANDSENGSLS